LVVHCNARFLRQVSEAPRLMKGDEMKDVFKAFVIALVIVAVITLLAVLPIRVLICVAIVSTWINGMRQ